MKKKWRLSPGRMIVLGFLLVILVGSLLLSLPIASAAGEPTPYMDALFTSATSVCVTGLTTVVTAAHWSLFGQIVILLLIQIGGLGIISISTAFLLLLHKKISLRDRVLLEEAFNLDTLSGLVSFLRRVLAGTLLVELVGALCCLPVFLSEYGARGIFFAVFHAVSAFCNAGIDLLGESSLIPYANHVWLNFVTMALIVLGGLGFVVWWDVLRVIGLRRSGRLPRGKFFSALSLHSRVVFVMTGALILGGAALIFIFEYTNPATMGGMPIGEKLLASLFQSVTSRTAGFATVSQKALTPASAIVTVILMFIGGSPIGTAGGVKTTTIAIFLLSVLATVRGEEETTVMRRTVPRRTVVKAGAVITIFLFACVAAILLLLTCVGGDPLDAVFEVVSAVGTVGLTRDYTLTLNTVGKLIIAICMYLGRVGPISLAMALTHRLKSSPIRYAEGNITVG